LNSTFCADEHLVRVGFMSRKDLRAFAKHVLSVANLGGVAEGDQFWLDGRAVAIVEQYAGPWDASDHDWLEYDEGEAGVCWCWCRGTEPGVLATPPGWYPDPGMTMLNPTEARERVPVKGGKTVRLYQARVFPDSEDH